MECDEVITFEDLDYRLAFELALTYAAHERIADKTGRCGWHQTESARLRAEPDGNQFLDPKSIPVAYLEWCWPL